MKLTETSVARPIGTAVICAAVLLIGLVSARKLPVDLLPEVDYPRISVVTTYEGVGPEEMETLVTRPIEQAVSTVEGVEEIEAESAEGISSVQLQFAWGTNLETAVNDVRAYLDRLGDRLPRDADRPVVHKFDLASVPVATIGLSGGGDPRRLRYLAEETLSRRLERVPGVANINVRGGRVREIRVELDASRLIALGVSAGQVAEALSRDNRNVASGDMRATGREVLIRSVGEWRSPEQIGGVLVTLRDGHPVYVKDVGVVLDTFAEHKSEQWVNGEPAITLRVSKQSGANTVEVVEGIRAELDRINRDYDGRLRASVLQESASFIQTSVTNVQSGGLHGAALSILVLLVFLRSLRATVLIGLAIPLCVIATFALMYFSGSSLNVISFGGLALGIGMLVDNAIVILENIYRKREEGLGPVRAAVDGTREVGPAVLAGTLTTVAVFAPVVFIGGFAGVFFGEMAAVVTFSLGCSLAVALTLVPSLAARLLATATPSEQARPAAAARLSQSIERGLSRVEEAYRRLVGKALRAPWFTAACALLLLVGSVRLSSVVGFELMPETDEGRIDIDIQLPVGTPIERTAALIQELDARARGALRPGELSNMISSAGPENPLRPGGTHEGEVELYLVPVSQRDRGIDEIMAAIRAAMGKVPGASIRMTRRSSNFFMRLMRGSSGERLEVAVLGHDLATAAELAERVQEVMEGVDGIADVRIEREEGLEERSVQVDAARAADLGVTRAEVADTVEVYVLGRVATRLREGGDEFDVRVQLREEDRRHLHDLGDLPIMTPSGEAVPLSALATLGGRRGPTSIAREGQERVLKVLGGLGDRPLSAVVADLDAALSRIELPDGFSVRIGGEHEEQEKTFGGLLTGVVLAILLVYAVMVVQFESLRHPLIIMTSVPFGFIGVIATLALTGTTFNMNSFLGAIVLVGVAVNNAIVLVDCTNALRREEGLALEPALLEACRRRLRPILMTTLTTVLGMLPLALGLGEGSEIQAPLARVVVGGLTTSTAVTLLLVPSLYFLVERGAEARAAEARAGEGRAAGDGAWARGEGVRGEG